MNVIALVQPPTEVCPAWHLRGERTRAAECRLCRMDVAIPSDRRVRPVCLYCAMDTGLVEPVEVEPEWNA